MKKVYEKWNAIPLILRIAVGLVIGAVVGILAPGAAFMNIFGNIFVGALKAIALYSSLCLLSVHLRVQERVWVASLPPLLHFI